MNSQLTQILAQQRSAGLLRAAERDRRWMRSTALEEVACPTTSVAKSTTSDRRAFQAKQTPSD
jgi:hypothetical protein